MAAESQTAVVLALLGNSFLTVIKSVAFLVSGSGAMLSEAIHSLADTANQALLLLGIRGSQRLPDPMFHYGYGAERYFFSLMSAVGIFVLGCGVTVYHGIHTLVSPPELRFSWITWAVLAIAALVDGIVLFKVLSAVKHESAAVGGFRAYLRQSTDPTVAAVLFEDGVALLGVLVAALGIGFSYLLGSTIPDALASILIGLMLGAVAIWLGLKNRQLILGQAVPPALHRDVSEFLAGQPTITRVHDLRTRVMGADQFRLKADVEFNGREFGRRLAAWVVEAVPRLETKEQMCSFAEEFGHRLVDAVGEDVDRIEAELSQRFPRLHFIDLEAD